MPSRAACPGKEDNMKSKQELIDFIARQTNITLENDPDSVLNSKRKILYTTITRNNRNTVLSLLTRKGIRYESHIHDNYFIYI
jgi:hypothetical protein